MFELIISCLFIVLYPAAHYYMVDTSLFTFKLITANSIKWNNIGMLYFDIAVYYTVYSILCDLFSEKKVRPAYFYTIKLLL